MKQILQNFKSGRTEVVEVPLPNCGPGQMMIRTIQSLVSSGTERMLVDFGKAGYLEKARQQPEKVRQVLNKARTDGLWPTVEAVLAKLDQPVALGYCNVGTVVQAESLKLEAQSWKVGDRVVSNGPHAEVVCVPENLCARVPDNVSNEEATFTVLGAIGLQGIRLLKPTIGECVTVTGLGLVGLLVVQILRANGCRVLGIDMDSGRCGLARQFGAETVDLGKGEDPVAGAMKFSQDRGVDGVIITAATKSSEPVHQAAMMCRKRGRIILVGVTGLELSRADFYAKELSFQVSCSYGPGRYDPEYEKKGHDYPIGYVRWTEQRNFEAVLNLMAQSHIDVRPLITHRFPFGEAPKAYELISQVKEPYMGIILEYTKEEGPKDEGRKGLRGDVISFIPSEKKISLEPDIPVVGVIGAGNFTGQVLLPAIKKTGARLKTIASIGGVSGTHQGKKHGFENSTTDVNNIFDDKEINAVFITTRHDTHAQLVVQALKAGKHVFVEKPLCLNLDELDEIKNCYNSTSGSKSLSPILMVGFNRRFSPHMVKIKDLLTSSRNPKSFIMTVNAGMVPSDHWSQDPEVGGGRIIGEACHFVDLLRFLSGSKIASCEISKLNSAAEDTVSIQLVFEDGSIGSIHYFANGNRRFPKERLEIFSEQKILQLDNFKTLKGYGFKKFRKMKLWRQDKGHGAEVQAFAEAISTGKPSPIPFEEIVETMQTTIQLAGL